MGEVSEMMLDGTLCEGCGVYMKGEAPGHPRKCHDCRTEDNRIKHGPKIACKVCGKRVKAVGMANHLKDAHPPAPALLEQP